MKTILRKNLWFTPIQCAALLLCTSASHAAVTKTQLAGNSILDYPHFEYVKAINENSGVEVAIDPTRFGGIIGETCDIYVVAAKTTAAWNTDQTLTDVTVGGVQTETFVSTNIQANTYQITGPSELNANAGMGLGVGYDVVLDCNQDGLLNGDDYIDGRHNEAGFYTIHDTTSPGPMAVTESTQNLDPITGATYGVPASYIGRRIFYPTDVVAANIDKDGDGTVDGLPLIIISHGNGHLYWEYDHIGNHLASYGYVVVSHRNLTGPGPVSASTTTLGHTDAFIAEVASGAVEGGVLTGHLDTSKIAWIGHSRGAEGVAIAYDRIFDGTYAPVNYAQEDIKLISSMLPTDFEGSNVSNPHDANYHLWTASGDADVFGGASNDIAQTYHLHDRATGHRQSTTVQGVGHAWFHNGTGNPVLQGPCQITKNLTHSIQLGHLLPLVKRYVEDNIPSLDFLTRQYESFRPMGVPNGNPCIVVSHEYRDASAGVTTHGAAFPIGQVKSVIIDDYQSEFSDNVSSSLGTVIYTVDNLTEGRLDDNNNTFTWMASDPFNGATQARSTDSSRGVVFDWTGMERYYEWGIPAAEQNFIDNLYLSFRGAQGTQHPNTLAILGDLTFDVTLRDTSGVTSSINIGAFGGGLEQPYQRGGGWHNEMETIRMRTTDFLNNGSGLDLSSIEAIRLEFGPNHGSPEGRIVIDDLTLTNDRALYDGADNGDPHITTVNGVRYDFQSAGEFVLLREGNTMEIQTRQTPVSSANAITNTHTGLKSCVSVNTAVVARVGKHRVTYQPNLSGKPDPSGLQLRIDGKLVDVSTLQSINLGAGGSVSQSPTGNGIEIDFPNGTTLIALPRWWGSQETWYLNLSVFNTPATEGVMGYIPTGDWLPALPSGASLGGRPAPLGQRYVDLNHTFANAWRVDNESSLFDYFPGTSTDTFTNKEWPSEKSDSCIIENRPRVRPVKKEVAQEACRAVINKDDKADCIKDVAVTGEIGFAQAFIESQKVDIGATTTEVRGAQRRSKVIFTALVTRTKTQEKVALEEGRDDSLGTVQFTLNGSRIGRPIELDRNGSATWATSDLDTGKYKLGAMYSPADKEGPLLPSASPEKEFAIKKSIK